MAEQCQHSSNKGSVLSEEEEEAGDMGGDGMTNLSRGKLQDNSNGKRQTRRSSGTEGNEGRVGGK
jgi:hypothetical protein